MFGGTLMPAKKLLMLVSLLLVSIIFVSNSFAFTGDLQIIASSQVASETFPPAGHLFNIFMPNANELVVGPNDKLYIETDAAAYVIASLSVDQGHTWRQIESGDPYTELSNLAFSPNFLEPLMLGGNRNNGGFNWIYVSDNEGFTWQRSIDATPPVSEIIFSPTYNLDQSIYLRSGDDVYLSTNKGENWAKLSETGNPTVDMALAPNFNDTNLIMVAREYYGARRSVDGGITWETLQNGLDLPSGNFVHEIIFSPGYANDNKIFARGSFGVYETTNNGNNWKLVWPYRIEKIEFHPEYGTLNQTFFLIAQITIDGASVNALFKTTDNGKSFEGIIAYVRDFEFSWDYPANTTMYALTDYGFVQSANNGEVWYINSPLYPDLGLQQVAASPNYELDGTTFAVLKGNTYTDSDHRVWRLISSTSGYTLDNLSIPEKGNERLMIGVSPNFQNDNTIYILTGNYNELGKLYISVDRGENWTLINGSLPIEVNWKEFDLEFSPNFATDQTLFISSYLSGIYKSTNNGQSWQLLYEREGVTSIAPAPNYPTDTRIYNTHITDGIMLSSDGGSSWIPVTEPDNLGNYKIILSPNFSSDNTLYAIGDSVWRSADGGTTWVEINNGLLDYNDIFSMQISENFQNDQTLILQQERAGMLWTENAGDTWHEVHGMHLTYNNPALAMLTYHNGRPTPISFGRDGVYFYEWPQVSVAFNCKEITLNSGSPQVANLSISSSTPLPVKWEVTNGSWFNFVELTGTLPYQPQMLVDLSGISEPTSQVTTVDIYLSYRQVESKSTSVFAPCTSTNLPMVLNP